MKSKATTNWMRIDFLFCLLLDVCCSSLLADDNHWPRFRGPNAAGVAPDHAGLPITWSTAENVKWVPDVPGLGWSCPVVWGDRVFLTTVVNGQPTEIPKEGLYLGEGVREPAKGVHRWKVDCFDLNTGGVLWKHEAHAGQPQVPRHPKSTYASEIPTTDGERLHVLFGDLGLWCDDLDGKSMSAASPVRPSPATNCSFGRHEALLPQPGRATGAQQMMMGSGTVKRLDRPHTPMCRQGISG